MEDSTRARVASVLGAVVRDGKVSSVYDHSAGDHRSTTTRVENGKVQGYDYSTGSHFAGSNNSGTRLDFYDYDTSSHVQLRRDGNRFSGYDYHTGSHFSGTVNGRSISLYDHQTGQHYSYSV